MTVPVCVIIGGGGHGASILDCLQAQGIRVLGILDRQPARLGPDIHGAPVLGSDDLLPEMRQRGATHFTIGVGGTGDNRPRRALFERARSAGLKPLTVLHPSAICSWHAQIADGAQLLPGSIVNTRAHIGANVIVNTGAIVEHDCVVAEHVHIATGARLAGTVRIGEAAHIGMGAVVRQHITIGAFVVVGAGAVVINDVPAGAVVVGVPARPMKKVDPK